MIDTITAIFAGTFICFYLFFLYHIGAFDDLIKIFYKKNIYKNKIDEFNKDIFDISESFKNIDSENELDFNMKLYPNNKILSYAKNLRYEINYMLNVLYVREHIINDEYKNKKYSFVEKLISETPFLLSYLNYAGIEDNVVHESISISYLKDRLSSWIAEYKRCVELMQTQYGNPQPK